VTLRPEPEAKTFHEFRSGSVQVIRPDEQISIWDQMVAYDTKIFELEKKV
jgi:hypothetical protein